MRWLVVAFALYVQGGCAYQDWTVEDWDVYYRNCQVKVVDIKGGQMECEWRI